MLEHFQWKKREEVADYVRSHKDEIAEEIADVAMYLFELSDILGIDLIEAMKHKLQKNEERYPIRKAKGISTKSSEL